MGRFAERASVRIAIFMVIAVALVWTMLGTAGWMNEFRDAQVMTLHERAAVDTVHRFGELPLWNPWYCGGLYGLGAPQSRFASPTFLLSLLFGVERAEPLVIFTFAVLGMEGTYRWLRLRVPDASAALRVAPFFALCGHFAVAYFRGWTNFFGFELLPWVLYGITLAARGRPSGIAASSIAFTVMLGFGGTFAGPLVAVAATIEALRALSEVSPQRRANALFMLGAVASFMAVVAAVRLLPLAETLTASPRLMAGTPGHPPKTLLFYLVSSLEVKQGDVEEPGMFFVGGAFLALVALGGSDRKSVRPLVIVVAFLWLAAGYARKPALFALLRELPVFAALRYPERFLWIAILYAAEPAAYALLRVPQLGDGKKWRIGAHALLTLAVVGTVGAQIMTFVEVGKARELGMVAVDRLPEFRQARGNRWLAAHYDGIGAGSLSCWEVHPVIMSPKLRGDLEAEEYLADPTSGTTRRKTWAPNHINVYASLSRPGRLLVNQNWHPGWHTSVGTVVSDEGLLAVDLPAGEHDVALTFKPMTATAGGAVSLAALASLVLLLVVSRRGKTPFKKGNIVPAGLLTIAPWGVLAGFIGTWTEPRFPPAPMHNANGTPALVTGPDPSAQPTNIQFDIPVVIDAVRFDGPNYLSNITIDLYMRRTGSIARTTGMFVHVVRRPGQDPIPEPEKGKEKARDFFNADHQVVGGSFYLSDAPRGIMVHDAFGIHVGKGFRGQYDVFLAFGHVSGRKGRSHVIEAGGATVNEDRVQVGSFFIR